MIKRLLILVFLLFNALLAFPQQYNLHQLSVNDGLSHSDVNILVQDTSGFIWLGTNNGLARFDGYQFSIFKHDLEDSLSIPGNRIKMLFCDTKNRVWIATEKNSLTYYDPLTSHFHSMPLGTGKHQIITRIIEDEDQNLWFLTEEGSISKVEPDHGSFMVSGMLMPFKSGVSEIFAVEEEIWIGSENDGLWRLNTKNGETSKIENVPFSTDYTLFTMDDAVLVATNQVLYQVDSNLEVNELFRWSSCLVSGLMVDFKGDIWVGVYDGGVRQLSKDQHGTYRMVDHFTMENQLSTNRVNDLMIDSFDVLWIGTSGGGVHFIDLRAKPFGTINSTNKAIPDNYITAIYEGDESLWIGTRTGLVKTSRTGEASYNQVEGHISGLQKDRLDQFWVATRYNGLYLFKNEILVRRFTKQGQQGLSSNQVIGISEDGFGRLWVATFNHGATLIDIASGEILAYLNTDNYLPTNNLSYAYADPQHQHIIWLGSRDAGLLKVSFQEVSRISVESYQFDPADTSSISSNYTWPILRTNQNTLWVGTIGGGLNKVVEGTEGMIFHRFTEKDGLVDNDVEAILEDDNGDLWIGGRGLVQFNPQTETFVPYDVNDGLQSNSFKIGAAFKNNRGLLYFGGINGLNYFNPEAITPNPHQPKLILYDLRILNRSVKINERINGRVLLPKKLNYLESLKFKAIENEFTIDLLGLHYSNPGRNKYAYKLEGYNRDWVYLNADQRRVTFANLKPRTYKLMAKVSNGDAMWSNIRSLNITILPPWWATWWAYLIYGLTIFGLLYLYRLFMNRQASLRHDLLLAEKDKNLNQEKIKFFTNISHEIRTPLTLIRAPLEEIIEDGPEVSSFSEKLNLIQKNVNRLLGLTNQLLDFRKMDSGNMTLQVAEGNFINFAREVFLVFKHAAKEKKINYDFHVDQEDIRLTFDRDKFEIVLTNLISNAIKYTEDNGRVDISVKAVGKGLEQGVFERTGQKETLTGNYLEVTIRDNGIGISKDQVEKIFDRFYQARTLDTLSIQGTGIGLALVKGIVDLHHGEIAVQSAVGKGSAFMVKIPFGNAHFDPSELLSDFKSSEDSIHYQERLPDDQIIVEQEENSRLKPTVLIVEDNREVLGYLHSSLKPHYRVVNATNGEEGLEKAKFSLPDLIVSDVMMPVLNGLEMLNRIKSDPDLSFIPVILLTARTATLYELEGVELGAQDYITKPFNIKILKAKIASILAARESFKTYYEEHIQLQSTSVHLPNAEQKFLDDITKQVLDNLTNEDFSVQTLVREMGMSQSACYKRIKELTGRSAVQFIRDIRLKRSAELLRSGQMNVSEVAYCVGINDLKYFREKFKEQYGCNPSDYYSGKAVS